MRPLARGMRGVYILYTHFHIHTICNFGCGPLIFIFACRLEMFWEIRSKNTQTYKNTLTHTHSNDIRRRRRFVVVVFWLWLRLRCGCGMRRCDAMRRWKQLKLLRWNFQQLWGFATFTKARRQFKDCISFHIPDMRWDRPSLYTLSTLSLSPST